MINPIVKKIKIDDIQPQTMLSNRKRKEIEHSTQFISLVASVKEIHGIFHPIVVKETNEGKYILFSGFRRYLAYVTLNRCREEGYETIPATVCPCETPDAEMAKILIHENKIRKDPTAYEKVIQEISAIPVFLDCANISDVQKNKDIGYGILKHYLSYKRNGLQDKYRVQLVKFTGCDTPIERLRAFFEAIGESERSFYDKVMEIMEGTPEVIRLLDQGKITFRQAKDLRNLKSDDDRLEIIKLLQTNKVQRKEFDLLIKESRIKQSKFKYRDELLEFIKRLSNYAEGLNKELPEEQYLTIKKNMELIEISTGISKNS